MNEKEIALKILKKITHSQMDDLKANRAAKWLHIVNQIFKTFEKLFELLDRLPENCLDNLDLYSSSSSSSSFSFRFQDDSQTYNSLCEYILRLIFLIEKLNEFNSSTQQVKDLKNRLIHHYNLLLYLAIFQNGFSFDVQNGFALSALKSDQELIKGFDNLWKEIESLFSQHSNNNAFILYRHYSRLKRHEQQRIGYNPRSFLPDAPAASSPSKSNSPLKKMTSMPTLPLFQENNNRLQKTPSTPQLPEFVSPTASPSDSTSPTRKRSLSVTTRSKT